MHNPAGINRAAAEQTKNPMAKKSQTKSSSDRNIDIPPVSKSTAGAATGAVVGAIAGPMGAIVGGVIGGVLGKRAQENKPLVPPSVSKPIVRTARRALPTAKRALKSVTPSKSKRSGAKKSSARKSPAKKTSVKKTGKAKSAPARAKKRAGSSTHGKSTSKKRR